VAAPREHGIAGELAAIFAHDHAGLAPLGDQPSRLAHNTVSGDRGVWHCRQTLSGHIIETTLSTWNRLPQAI